MAVRQGKQSARKRLGGTKTTLLRFQKFLQCTAEKDNGCAFSLLS